MPVVYPFQGNLTIAWGFLWHLREAFASVTPTVAQSAAKHAFHVYAQLGYSLADQRRLECSLLSWMFSIGAITTA